MTTFFGLTIPFEYFLYVYLFNAIMMVLTRIQSNTLPQRMDMYRHYLSTLSAEELDREAIRLNRPH